MPDWLRDENTIACDIDRVTAAVAHFGTLTAGVVALMPGITEVELLDEGPDSMTLRTNEGLMTRTGITTTVGADSVVVDFDEEYQAGSAVTTRSHVRHEFSAGDGGVVHRIVVSGFEAPGPLGFLYRTLARRSMGRAFLSSHQAYSERPGAETRSGVAALRIARPWRVAALRNAWRDAGLRVAGLRVARAHDRVPRCGGEFNAPQIACRVAAAGRARPRLHAVLHSRTPAPRQPTPRPARPRRLATPPCDGCR